VKPRKTLITAIEPRLGTPSIFPTMVGRKYRPTMMTRPKRIEAPAAPVSV
jgi:hypothetical protein